MKRSLEFLWKLLDEFPGWSARYEHRKRARLQGSPQSNGFPRGVFPRIKAEMVEQGGNVRVSLPNSPDVQAQFSASIRRAERIEDGAYRVPKTAESVVKAWVESVKALQHKKEFYQKHKNTLSDSIVQNYEQAFEIEYTHNSTAIEGNTLSLIETKLLLEDKISINTGQRFLC